jgi:hypothetical protein
MVFADTQQDNVSTIAGPLVSSTLARLDVELPAVSPYRPTLIESLRFGLWICTRVYRVPIAKGG